VLKFSVCAILFTVTKLASVRRGEEIIIFGEALEDVGFMGGHKG
jgi:hypothetical protein